MSGNKGGRVFKSKKIKKTKEDFYYSIDYKLGETPGEGKKVIGDYFSPLEMSLVSYNLDQYSCKSISDITVVSELERKDIVNWLIVSGFGGDEFLEKLKKNLGFHGLTIEAILDINHPPKLEFREDSSLFIILRLIPFKRSGKDATVSLAILGSNLYWFCPAGQFYLIEKLIGRIENKRGVVRKRGIDYLLFAIINLVIDSYFPQIDTIADSIKKIDQNIFDSRNKNLLKEVKAIRQALNIYFNNLSPIRDIISRLISDDSNFVKPENVKYFKHAFNHTTFLCERINRLKESTSDIMNLNISMNGQKMNEIMKILTMISSIFIPLSFICGLYGMNFNTEKSPFNMPELNWYYGYPFILGFMLTLVIGIILYFYKKKWF